jgi:uncharacterized protein with HEPN domain
MSRTEKNLLLGESVARLIKSLDAFSSGTVQLKKLVELRDEVVKHLTNIPGIFLISSTH